MAMKYGSLPAGPSADTVTDPQQLFQALPSKAKRYAYLRDVQGDVLSKWQASPKHKDTVIKMNTGGGKTTVGLLIAKASMNEGVGPAVYLCPDHYLCSQVAKEADELGLRHTDDPRSRDFQASTAILICPIQVLFNGMSKFGVGRNLEIEIGTVIIDDAHACLAIAEEKFTLSVSRSEPAYAKLLDLFDADLKTQSVTSAQEVRDGDPRGFVQVPFWAWADKQQDVIRILADGLNETDKKFVWPLAKENLPYCRCFFQTQRIEIGSTCLPVEAVPAFERAKRRIYMTATLADDFLCW